MKTTGQILKDKRESLNLTISEVALSTKINPKILTAMEAGDSQRLPSQTFLKGFVKSYASYLKLDQDQVLRTFIEETNPPATEAGASSRVEPTVQSHREVETESNSAVKAVAVGSILVLIGLIFGVRELINKYQKETVVEEAAQIKVTPLENESASEAKTTAAAEASSETQEETQEGADAKAMDAKVVAEESTPEVTPAAAAVAPAPPETKEAAPTVEAKLEPVATAEIDKSTSPITEEINPLASFVDKYDFTKPKVEEKPKEPEAKKEATAVEAKTEAKSEAKVEEKKVEEKKAEEKAPEEVKAAEAKPEEKKEEKKEDAKTLVKNEIILEALDKVDIRMDIKGTSKKLSLGPTEVHTIRASGPVKFDFSDGGAVNIILNGRERGVPGDLGKPKQVNIP